jgi:cytoskeletal protein RodZ
MKTVGDVLRETRLSKNVTLEIAEKETKIRKNFLVALEQNEFGKLPSQAYAKGFIHNYSEFLGLNSKTMMAFYRRQTLEIPKSSILPKKPNETLESHRYVLTPGRFVILFISVLLFLLLIYFGLQYRKLQVPPSLSLDSPKTSMTTTSKRIDVTGSTDPDATISINGISVLVRSDGKFFDQVQLFSGKNTITITATSRYGKVSTTVREVTVSE